MTRQASLETQLNSARREIRALTRDLSFERAEGRRLRLALAAERKIVEEWRVRFDALLARTPKAFDRRRSD